ncbi:RluA family pseudouridine synthase [Clostridium beijerinckii]|jgi:ribosomal large subunit pseudouridine synthase D (EC 5.4.99.-)|uniref:Pseudouridine synthase n=2 Tax=Clostridium beijerinckii TaxID=1520 RepID=A0AAE2RWM1_CLOBE|nr:RluA family pseudouridine synthase [Clostridium beijerinckii]ABR33769.1 pseudouridine synthase, RluA family [Clostridium beijerinckii NCIMB 8052]AIU04536.1 RluA family pseudouridine synthase [Clostridium beijerinckii ATCC 35702]MBF7812191.1 RluA family pseudouridine synthase [Clostridium beijerinckii]NRT24950.1 23S rRNA pseudouridine1911/1915/1917 synthase [Clostridium beijerinckii]NRT67456.1 23S rRNA pseudouridine1911/1915/1917 synthase [Clostridium beijerinckii]
MEKNVFIVDEKDRGERIDKYLAEIFVDKSRSFIQGLIEKDDIKVNNKTPKSNYKLRALDEIEVTFSEPEVLRVEAEEIPINILYEDKDVVVVNKPQGMVVHPAPGNYNGTLVNALLYHCKDLSSINGIIRPGIVHRIDKDTSGVLVVAKNDEAHNKLSDQLKDHSMKREYYALVEGRLKNDKGIIDKPLARNKRDRLKIGIVEGGKRAVTHYEVLERFNGYTLIKCILETGRTHQIRVHMASIGFPLVGDPLYGFKKQRFKLKGQVLHAKTLGFVHPSKNEYMEFTTELPEYFQEIIEKLRNEVR